MKYLSAIFLAITLGALPVDAEPKDGDAVTATGTIHVFDGAFIGGEGCAITMTVEESEETICLEVGSDSTAGELIDSLKEKSASVEGVWHYHEGVETEGFWFVEVTSVKGN